jgi:cobalt-zinc-cadmium efflux system protein
VLVGRENNCHELRRALERELHDRFDIAHTTLQVDREGGDLLTIEHPEQRGRSGR